MATNLKDKYAQLTIKLAVILRELNTAEIELHKTLDQYDDKNARPIRKAFNRYSKIFNRFDRLTSVRDLIKARIDLGQVK